MVLRALSPAGRRRAVRRGAITRSVARNRRGGHPGSASARGDHVRAVVGVDRVKPVDEADRAVHRMGAREDRTTPSRSAHLMAARSHPDRVGGRANILVAYGLLNYPLRSA